MHVVDEKCTLGQLRDDPVYLASFETTAGRVQTIQQTLLILVGLEPSDHPRSGVGESPVVHIDRILRCQEQSHAKGARLLEHAQQDGPRGRVRYRWQVTHNLVEIDEHAQAAGSSLRAHPGFNRGQEQRHKEHALVVIQVGDVEYVVPGLT